MIVSRLIATVTFAAVVVCALVILYGASSADAESPWWGITSGSRPTNLHAGVARDEVQEVVIKATGGMVILAEPISVEEEEREEGETRAAFINFDASAAEVESGLETVYGIGNVKVSGGPGDATGSKPYMVTFTGELADRFVRPIDTGLSILVGFTGEANVTEVAGGQGDGQVFAAVENLGAAGANGGEAPISITDTLPRGLRAIQIEAVAGGALEGVAGGKGTMITNRGPVECSLATTTCTFEGELPPYEQIEVVITVAVEQSSSPGGENEVNVSGGGAGNKSDSSLITVGGETTFGIEDYKLAPEEIEGEPASQAGSRPFQMTTTVAFNETHSARLAALPKDLQMNLPRGLIGNPAPFPQCTDTQFAKVFNGINECPSDTALGVATVTVDEPSTLGVASIVVPLFNLKPTFGEPGRFGFEVEGSPVTLDTSIRGGQDYGVTMMINDITQTSGFLNSNVTIWGVPGDPRHNDARGWSCIGDGVWQENNKEKVPPCGATNILQSPPLLTLPTLCDGTLRTSVTADSWSRRGQFLAPVEPVDPPIGMRGCNQLHFDPAIDVTPDVSDGSAPSGLTVGIHVPQDATLNSKDLAESALRDATVVLPAGLTVNPGGADGLEACSESQIGLLSGKGSSGELLFTPNFPDCPDGSKIGSVEIDTPLLSEPLSGSVYLASQDTNPFGSLVAMYIVAEDPTSGTLVKLAGDVTLDPVSGQLTAAFDGTPELPFEDLRLSFFGGPRAPLSTPASCGAYTTVASLLPWSGSGPVSVSSHFDITAGPKGDPCATPRPFAPGFSAGTMNIQAGAFSQFAASMTRPDADQPLGALSMTLPPGLLGLLSSVKLCPEPQASLGTCGQESLIGHMIVSAGLGNNPVSVKRPGEVFITGPYKGAPYGLTIVNAVEAGPFNLGTVIVRAKLEVDVLTAQLTIVSDPLPTILKGIPLQLQRVNVTIDRPGFTFNPTSCTHMAVDGTITSSEGAKSEVSTPFQVANCGTLGFKPTFNAKAAGRTSRKYGASLSGKLVYPKARSGSQANIRSMKIDLPKQMPSRLTTLQKACTAAMFNANPAGCPKGSRVGEAIATTSILPVQLRGPAYFVSYGSKKFPELVIVLSGYGVTIDLRGETLINKKGVTSSTFRGVPDVPIDAFELRLPEGQYSALTATGNLCKATLAMPAAFTAQNGLFLHQSKKIVVDGCPKAGNAEKRKRGK